MFEPYRKALGSGIWHFCSNCQSWPIVDYSLSLVSEQIEDQEFCAECIARHKLRDCRSHTAPAKFETFRSAPSKKPQPTILIVEDNPNARRLLAIIVSNAGYEAIESRDGEEALRLLNVFDFRLVITDLAMPKITGLGLIAHIRRNWPALPVILVTAYLSPEVARNVLAEQVEFIPKPIDRDYLITTVNRLVPLV